MPLPRSSPEHLLNTSQTSAQINFDGFAGALLSGIICAAAADGLTVWLDVVRAIGLRALLTDLICGGCDLTERYKQKA